MGCNKYQQGKGEFSIMPRIPKLSAHANIAYSETAKKIAKISDVVWMLMEHLASTTTTTTTLGIQSLAIK